MNLSESQKSGADNSARQHANRLYTFKVAYTKDDTEDFISFTIFYQHRMNLVS